MKSIRKRVRDEWSEKVQNLSSVLEGGISMKEKEYLMREWQRKQVIYKEVTIILS